MPRPGEGRNLSQNDDDGRPRNIQVYPFYLIELHKTNSEYKKKTATISTA